MCGIAGIVFFNSATGITISQIKNMTSIVKHRGPDDEGYALFFENRVENAYIYGGEDTPLEIFQAAYPYTPDVHLDQISDIESLRVVLTHRRLSIIDLSPGGHQPMSYKNQRYWIIYNGEIYNSKEIRTELEKLGHIFLSRSDTEVILAAYAQWGKECLHHFNGMWAFVIFDSKTNILFAARDRFGVKPFYYWFSPNGFVAFASEIKQFTVLPGWKATINEPRVYDFLVSRLTDQTSETLFKDVFQLCGGDAFEATVSEIHNSLPVYHWYSLKNDSFGGTFDEASQNLRSLLEDSIRLRLRSDVPVGSCLSGGLDSSSIVCLVSTILRNGNAKIKQKTFSACSEIKKFDEREYIDEVLENRSIEAHYVYPSVEDLLRNLDDMIWHQDEPFGSTSILAQWEVFQLASQNYIKVMLDGQGADEMLCGYHVFFGARHADLFRNFKWVTLIREIIRIRKIHKKSIKHSIYLMSMHLIPSKWEYFFKKYFVPELISPPWLNTEKIKNNIYPDGFQKSNASNFIEKESYSQLIFTNLPQLLHYEDRNSMAHSVESRVPFLDYRLVEFIYQLPSEFKIKGETTKVIFRESMRGVLPEKIRTRMDKMGFVTAEEYWVIKENPEVFKQLLNESIEFSQGILNYNAIRQLNDMIEGKVLYNQTIWRLICFGRWMKIFNVTT